MSVAGVPAAVLADIGGGALAAEDGGRTIIIGEGAGLRSGAVIVQVADRVGQRVGAEITVVMAGFGTILEKQVHDAFPGRILNTHPSLLPAFPGWHSVQDALEAGVKVTGCTIHVAVPEVDAGPILAQEAVPVLDGDTVESLHERIKAVERRLYPDTIKRLVAA